MMRKQHFVEKYLFTFVSGNDLITNNSTVAAIFFIRSIKSLNL